MVFYYFVDGKVQMVVSDTLKGANAKITAYAQDVKAKKISLMEVM